MSTTGLKRGRPKQTDLSYDDTKEELMRIGLVALTSTGFVGTGLEPMLRKANIPKGSFYHYFESKEAFGLALLARYRSYFENKLDKHLNNGAVQPLVRLQNFMEDARQGMEKYDFERGCLIGNLEQEATFLSDTMRLSLCQAYQSWQDKVADCLRLAQRQGVLAEAADIDVLAHVFWVGWEGAVSRARLLKSSSPLQQFETFYLTGLSR